MERGLDPSKFPEKKGKSGGRNEEEEEDEDAREVTLQDVLATRTIDELEQLEEDGFDDIKTLDEYREKRLRELKIMQALNRFGTVYEITKDEWLREVTECSHTCHVLIHLYQDYVEDCRLMDDTLQIVAQRFKYVKILRIRSTQASENWPDSNLPTLFVYDKGALAHTLSTLKEVGGKGMTPQDLEWWLATRKIVTSELEGNPRTTAAKGGKGSASSSSSPSKGGAKTVFRRGAYDDDDDDDDDMGAGRDIDDEDDEE